MPILDNEEFVIKAKNEEGKFRIVGSLKQGDYGPRLSLINSKLLRDALAKVKDDKRAFFPVYLVDSKENDTVQGETDGK